MFFCRSWAAPLIRNKSRFKNKIMGVVVSYPKIHYIVLVLIIIIEPSHIVKHIGVSLSTLIH